MRKGIQYPAALAHGFGVIFNACNAVQIVPDNANPLDPASLREKLQSTSQYWLLSIFIHLA